MGWNEFGAALLGVLLSFSVFGVIAAIKICDFLGQRIDILSKRLDDIQFRGR